MAPKTIPLDEVVQVLRRQAQLHENHAFSMFIEAAAQHLELQDQLLATYAKHIGAAHGDLLDNYKIALQEFLDKTEWVQKTCAGHELGMHRADVLKLRIESLQSSLEWAQGFANDLKVEVESQKKLLDGLRDLCGYVENGTSTALKISQDDATKDWVVTVGKDSVFGRSFKDVVRSAIEKFGGGL